MCDDTNPSVHRTFQVEKNYSDKKQRRIDILTLISSARGLPVVEEVKLALGRIPFEFGGAKFATVRAITNLLIDSFGNCQAATLDCIWDFLSCRYEE